MADTPPISGTTPTQKNDKSDRVLAEVEQNVVEIKIEELPDLVSNSRAQLDIYDSDDNLRNLEAERIEVELLGRRQYFKIRRDWLLFLMIVMSFEFLFQWTLLIAVGLNIFNFMKYGALLEIVVGSNFVQIISLVAIVVRYLFPHPNASITKDKAPKP